MAFVEICQPFLLERREAPPDATTRFSRKFAEGLEVGFEFGVEDCEPGAIALLCDTVGFPFFLLGDRGQVYFAG